MGEERGGWSSSRRRLEVGGLLSGGGNLLIGVL